MVKFEGMAGIKLEWLITQFCEELKVKTSDDKAIVKRAFVEVLMERFSYDDLLDAIADYISENYEVNSAE